jgi:hypothetical protein
LAKQFLCHLLLLLLMLLALPRQGEMLRRVITICSSSILSEEEAPAKGSILSEETM